MERVRTVIVVDDDVDFGAVLAEALRARGFDARAVHAPHHAFRLAATAPPDAWIVDHGLPGMMGDEIVRSLRESPRPDLRRAAIVAISGDPSARGPLLAAGADVFVEKPSHIDEMVTAIEAGLASVRAAPVAGR